MNTNLLYTIAQVSATFVAIIAGFYTSKILTISSEKQRIRNKIAEIDAEIEQRKANAAVYKSRFDRIYIDRAKELINDFVGDLLADDDDLKEYSLEELITKFEQHWHFEQVDAYQRQALTELFDNIKERIKKELEARAQSTPKKMPNGLGLSTAKRSIFDSLNALNENERREGNRVNHLVPVDRTNEDNFLRESLGKHDDELKEIAILQKFKQHHTRELESASFPQHIMLGYASQIVFAIFGVALPLIYGTWPNSFTGLADTIALYSFGFGLVSIFVYILVEVKTALKNK